MTRDLSIQIQYLIRNGLADMSAALFIIALGIGSLIGPLVGGAVYDNFGGNVDPKLFPE